MDSRILVPVRYSAWLSGDLGRRIEATLRHALDGLPDLRLTRMPRGFLVEAAEEPGPLVEATQHAVSILEDAVARRYPIFHHEMGPVWTGTLQVVFAQPAHAPAEPTPAGGTTGADASTSSSARRPASVGAPQTS